MHSIFFYFVRSLFSNSCFSFFSLSIVRSFSSSCCKRHTSTENITEGNCKYRNISFLSITERKIEKFPFFSPPPAHLPAIPRFVDDFPSRAWKLKTKFICSCFFFAINRNNGKNELFCHIFNFVFTVWTLSACTCEWTKSFMQKWKLRTISIASSKKHTHTQTVLWWK